MQVANAPLKWLYPWAQQNTNLFELPATTTAGNGRASQSIGFPVETMLPPESGGGPPQGIDFNAGLYQISRIAWWLMYGGAFSYDSTFATNAAISGYAQGSEIASNDYLGAWISTVDNNQINPDTVGTNWVPGYVYGRTTIALTNVNVTLTPLQAAKKVLIFTGTLTGNVVVTLPAWLYTWTVINNCSGAFTLTVTTSGGSGAAVPQNGATTIRGDGTNLNFDIVNVPTAVTASQAVPFSQVSGVAGTTRNLKITVAAAGSSMLVTADEILVETALGGLRYCLANFSDTLVLTGTGYNGMDTGSSPVSGYVAVYAIYNPSTGQVGLLAQNATSVVVPTIYANGHMPTGFTASALVSVWPTNGSGQVIVGLQTDRRIRLAGGVQVLNTTAVPASFTNFSISAAVPPNANAVVGTCQVGTTVSAQITVILADITGSGPQYFGYSTSTGNRFNFEVSITTAQQMAYQAGTNAGTLTTTVTALGYNI